MHLVRVPTIIIIQWKGILITYNFLLMDWFGLHSICSVGLKTAFYFRDNDFDNCSLIKFLNSLKFAHNFVFFESFRCTSLDSFHLSILKIRNLVTALLSLRYEIFAGCVEFLVECICWEWSTTGHLCILRQIINHLNSCVRWIQLSIES